MNTMKKNGKKYGAERYRLMLFGTKVQQSLSTTYHKRLTNLNSDNSLEGLVIDWQFADTERMFNDFVEPVMDYEPTYAYA